LYLGSRKGDAKPLLEPELDTYLTLY
jgi:hypothetical protein